MSIWSDKNVEWSQPPGSRLVELLERAYPNEAEIKAVARLLNLSTDVVGPTYSAHNSWLEILTEAASRDLVLDLASDLMQRGDDVWKPSVQELLGEYAGQALLRQYRRFGLPRESSGLEAFNSSAPAVTTQRQLALAVSQAERRIAVINRGGHHVGTGCLIGLDLLLTACHVIATSELEDTVAIFDHGVPQSATGYELPRVHLTELLASSDPAISELPGHENSAAWHGISSDNLDFAIVRLERPIAAEFPLSDERPRGFYPLLKQIYDLQSSPHLSIVHHGAGLNLLNSATEGTFELNEPTTRIRYRASTFPGSSGGPIIDRDGRLVAVHTGTVAHPGQGSLGQAVPIWRIAEATAGVCPEALKQIQPTAEARVALPGKHTDDTMNEKRAHLLNTLEIADLPFVNRSDLRQLLIGCSKKQGSRRIVIEGDANAGISSTYTLISHAAAELQGQSALKVDLRRYKSIPDPHERQRLVMEDIVGQLLTANANKDDQPLPRTVVDEQLCQHARDLVRFTNFCTRQLRHDARQWWIFFDSIDEVALLNGGLDELLTELVALTKDQQLDLRLILAGQAVGRLPAKYHSGVAHDAAFGLTRDHARTWLKRKAKIDELKINKKTLKTELDNLFPARAGPPSPDDVQLRLPAILHKVTS